MQFFIYFYAASESLFDRRHARIWMWLHFDYQRFGSLTRALRALDIQLILTMNKFWHFILRYRLDSETKFILNSGVRTKALGTNTETLQRLLLSLLLCIACAVG